MAVTDTAVMILLTSAVNFFLLWNKGYLKRIVADIIFLAIGFATHFAVSVTEQPWGILIMAIAAIDLVWNVLSP